MAKNPSANAGAASSICGLGRALGDGNGNPLQCSCLEKSYAQRSLEGYGSYGHKESDTTEQMSMPRTPILTSSGNSTFLPIIYIKKKKIFSLIYFYLSYDSLMRNICNYNSKNQVYYQITAKFTKEIFEKALHNPISKFRHYIYWVLSVVCDITANDF